MTRTIVICIVIVAAAIWMVDWGAPDGHSAGRERSPAAGQPPAEVVRRASPADNQSATPAQPIDAAEPAELQGASWAGGEARPSTDWLEFPRNTRRVRWILANARKHDFSSYVWRNQTLNPRDSEIGKSARSLLPAVFQKCLDYRKTMRSRIQAEYEDLAALAEGGRPALKRELDPAKTAKLREMLASMYPDPKELSMRFDEAVSMSTATWKLAREYDVIVHHDTDFYGANYDELPHARIMLEQEKLARRACVESLVGLFQIVGVLTQSEAYTIVRQITSRPLPKGAR